MLRRLIITTLIDIVLIALWDYWANSIHVEQEEAIGIILIVPAIIVVSGIVGLLLRFRKNIWGRPILINMFIALTIFFLVFKYEGWKKEHDNYLTFYFSHDDKIYNVTLKLNKAQLQDGLTYNIYERLSEYGNVGTDLDGSYTTRNDTLILTSEKGKVMKIFGRTLFDYPQKGDLMALRKKPD
jgi:hypothetical protein